MLRALRSTCVFLLLGALPLSACVEPKFVGSVNDSSVEGPDDGGDGARPEPDTAVDADDVQLEVPDAKVDAGDAKVDAGDAKVDAGDAKIDAAADGATPDSRVPPPDATVRGDGSVGDPEECLTGWYALKMDAELTWERTEAVGITLLRKGSGRSTLYARMSLDATGSPMITTASLCGAEFPDFYAGDGVIINEAYGLYIPTAVWDVESMPLFQFAIDRACDTPVPGCALTTSAPIAMTVGATKYVAPPADIVPYDHDKDGFPGLSFRTRLPPEKTANGTLYQALPVALVPPRLRSDHVFAAIHVSLEMSGKMADCGAFAGELNKTQIAIRAAGCQAWETPESPRVDCGIDQLRLLSNNVPVVSVKSAAFQAKRVPNHSDCAAVRAQFGAP